MQKAILCLWCFLWSVSCWGTENQGYKEQDGIICTNLYVINKDTSDKDDTSIPDSDHLSLYDDHMSNRAVASSGSYAHLTENASLPLESARGPQTDLTVYLPRDKQEFKQVHLPVVDGSSADVSQTLRNWKEQAPFLVLSFGDSQLPGSRSEKGKIILASQDYLQYSAAVKTLLQGHTKPVLVLFSGDGVSKSDNDPNSINLFVEFLSSLKKNLPDGSQIIYTFGNNDVGNQKLFEAFMQEYKDRGLTFRILTNTPSLWKDEGLRKQLDTVAYVNNSVGVVPYFTNMIIGREKENILNRKNLDKDFLLNCRDFFHDAMKHGYPDFLFGCPVDHKTGLPGFDSKGLSSSQSFEDQFNQGVALFGDRSVLNPLSEETADIFFSTLTKLANNNPGTDPITMVVVAHDYYLRPMIFYEMMSRFVLKYQMDENILKRLKVIICAGHEHCAYSGKKPLFLKGKDGKIYKIPCSFGASGQFLNGINIFAPIPGNKVLSAEEKAQWLHMEKRLYKKYHDWRLKTGSVISPSGKKVRPQTVQLSRYILTPESSVVQPEYGTLPELKEEFTAPGNPRMVQPQFQELPKVKIERDVIGNASNSRSASVNPDQDVNVTVKMSWETTDDDDDNDETALEEANINIKGGVWTPDQTSQVKQMCSASALTSLEIGPGVTSIGEKSFRYQTDLTKISLPSSVTSIGMQAFYNCSKLTQINIPENVTEIGRAAFSGCQILTHINIPKNVTSIGRGVFNGCSELAQINIPETVAEIESDAFSGCKSLTHINIPKNVTYIGDSAFAGCSSLTQINIPENVTYIGDSAFAGCSSLTQINIPENVTEIHPGTFLGCSELTQISIPSRVTAIYLNAFAECCKLAQINLPNNLKTIGTGAFRNCRGLTQITLPSSVKIIASGGFKTCNNLRTIIVTLDESRKLSTFLQKVLGNLGFVCASNPNIIAGTAPNGPYVVYTRP